MSWPGAAVAAEVFQVRSATLLQIGDGNRNYGVELACVGVDADDQLAATAWLRQQLPRRTRVNLRPLAEQGGLLLAQVSRLDREGDIGSALIAAGLAHLDPSPSAAACSGPEPS